MTDLVVLLPFKDAQSYIGAAMDSILGQSRTSFTVLAIDDGSSDRTRAIIESYQDDRVRLLAAEGSGVSAALNTGLDRCDRAALVARHDADDISHPHRFAEQVAWFAEHPDTTVLASWAELIDESGQPDGRVLSTPTDHAAICQQLRTHNPICHGSVMFRAGPVSEAGGYDTSYPVAQGYQLWVRLAARYRLCAIPKPLYRYRYYEQSWSHRNRLVRDPLLRQIAEQAANTLS